MIDLNGFIVTNLHKIKLKITNNLYFEFLVLRVK